MTDLDTILYLEEFKKKYLAIMKAAHENNMSKVKFLKDDEYIRAKELEDKYLFLDGFVKSIEATLEQNAAIKLKQQLN